MSVEEAELWNSYRKDKKIQNLNRFKGRKDNVLEKLESLGLKGTEHPEDLAITFTYKGRTGTIYPQRQWWALKGLTAGKQTGQGRGLQKFWKALEEDMKQ